MLVIKETALSQSNRAARFARKGDATARRLIGAHSEHRKTVEAVRNALARRKIDFTEATPSRLNSSIRRKLAAADLVITIGGDGTALGTSHYVTNGALLGVNSAPGDSIGHFCFAQRKDFSIKLDQMIRARLRPVKLARLAVSLDEKPVAELALNDVLITHECPAATTRYIIEIADRAEEHRSSGVWISTAAGSTAGIRSAGGRALPLRSRRIQHVVRELYRERGRSYDLIQGIHSSGAVINVASKMPEGRLYIDGARTVYRFPFGTRAEVKLAPLDLRIFLDDSTRL